MMRRVLLLAVLALSGCDRVGDHPETFIKVHTGTFDRIQIIALDGYLSVTGAWTIDGDDKIAAPINVSTVRCIAEYETCRISRAEVMTLSGTTWLMDREDTYPIESWDARQVIAVDNGNCRRNELRIDIARNTVTEITDNAPGGNCSSHLLGPVEKARVARMVSSEELEVIKRQEGV